jgi:hypothetical protein
MIGEVLYIAHRCRRALILGVPTVAAGWVALIAHHHHLF